MIKIVNKQSIGARHKIGRRAYLVHSTLTIRSTRRDYSVIGKAVYTRHRNGSTVIKKALTMGRKMHLTDVEEGKIDALLQHNLNVPAIAKTIRRSETAVRNYLKRKKTGKIRGKGGRPGKLSPRQKWSLVKIARKPGMTARKVRAEAGVEVSIRTVQRTLADNEFMEFGSLQCRPKLEKDKFVFAFSGLKI